MLRRSQPIDKKLPGSKPAQTMTHMDYRMREVISADRFHRQKMLTVRDNLLIGAGVKPNDLVAIWLAHVHPNN